MNKQAMISKIYEVIKPTYFGYGHSILFIGNGVGMTDNHSIEKVMIGDVLDWMAKTHKEWSFTVWGDGTMNFGDRQGKVKMRDPIENQNDDFILFIYNLINEL